MSVPIDRLLIGPLLEDMSVERTITIGLRVDAIAPIEAAVDLIDEALQTRNRFLMTFINPGTAMIAQRQPAVAGLFDHFDLVAPDGIAMVQAIRLLHGVHGARISFDSTALAPFVFRLAEQHDSRIVLVGGKPGVAERARRQLLPVYKKLNIIATLHGYGDLSATIATVAELAPDIVICGMGVSLQESFLLKLSDTGWIGVGITCGGFLDQLSQGVQYYPTWVNSLNLRWAYRLMCEPRRLWRRYLLDYPKFGVAVGKAILRRERPIVRSNAAGERIR
jgi:N-acetylglucosaminyldiphosphoundecaprenol N-acetyl-beta-D-mannosaminyltransferase